MPSECNPERYEFARVEGRKVVASFDGGRITSDAGALLLGAADRVIGLTSYQYFGDRVEVTRTSVSYKPDGSVDQYLESRSER